MRIAYAHERLRARKKENAQAIQAYNRYVEEEGVFGDGLSKF